MKSFSIKALALAFIVVAGSAQAGITDTVKGYVKAADLKLFGKLKTQLDQSPMSDTFGEEISAWVNGGYRPFSTVRPYVRNGYVRAAVIVAAVAGISAAVVKGYKHFTKPAADATVEGENVDANVEATPVAQ